MSVSTKSNNVQYFIFSSNNKKLPLRKRLQYKLLVDNRKWIVKRNRY